MSAAYDLPGLNCGLCGFRMCTELAERLKEEPHLIKRCIPLSKESCSRGPAHQSPGIISRETLSRIPAGCAVACSDAPPACGSCSASEQARPSPGLPWHDSLGREFDFYLEHFPEDPGPREIIIPHNPMLTRELEITAGETVIGRPLGMSCGCPVTHCGVVVKVEKVTGIITWCVTGPLKPRREGFKDLGYYSAEAYEGVIRESRSEIRIGMRYFFQPRMCMLQWRHSGLVNYINRMNAGLQVRLEGLWIG